jgi:hypothetical protein
MEFKSTMSGHGDMASMMSKDKKECIVRLKIGMYM